jgi:CHAT domain-containing protein
MADIFNLNLQTDLLTLSACESRLNTLNGGDELIGLSRACLYAGAVSLLLTLWRVADHATSQLMQVFYWKLGKEGLPKTTALREAQLALLQSQTEYAHPYYWAAFRLIGDTEKLINNEEKISWQ